MSTKQRIVTALKALRELGLQQLGLYALYRLQLHSYILTWRTKAALRTTEGQAGGFSITHPLTLPQAQQLRDLLGSEGLAVLIEQAEEMLSGKVRLFAGEPESLDLSSASSHLFWTDLELGRDNQPGGDIKPVWEIGRFGWAITLARAYLVSGDERCPQVFWDNLQAFLEANPPYFGHHWTSAQEVALRLIALSLSAQVFHASLHSTDERKAVLGRAIATHAARIPPTLSYARAQGNNHLLVEAAGLYTAGVVLLDHPKAGSWREMGWRWANKALLDQISPDGSYVQQSTNYHRLMLQAVLWLDTLAAAQGDSFEPAVRRRLAAATGWLLSLLDQSSGQVPNLGPNDGAYILPLSSCPFQDFRPVLQAAGQAFLGSRLFEPGLWDEMAVWLPGYGAKVQRAADFQRAETQLRADLEQPEDQTRSCTPLVLRGSNSWAYLRAAKFNQRPGHADQLHLDLWWRGLNIARDAGTYLYSAAPPWDNALASTLVHNTVSVNGQDQMTRAGRFLWLDWAQASELLADSAGDDTWQRRAAQHNGYRRLGVIHRRAVTCLPDERWLVEDSLTASSSLVNDRSQDYTARLHWLLPDWSWDLTQEASQANLALKSPYGSVLLSMSWYTGNTPDSAARLQLARAGELLAGEGPVSPVSGWYSPVYACKLPALALSLELQSGLPLDFKTEWSLA
ncbi:MAG: alginate lyase family protein [Anaerolineales bacterium]